MATRLNKHCRSPSCTSSLYFAAQSRIAATSCAVGLRPICVCAVAATPLEITTNSAVRATRRATPSPRLLKNLTADEHAADFAGAGADLVEFGVAQKSPGRIVVDVAVAAEALDGLERHPGSPFGRIENGAGGVFARGLAAVAGFGDGIDIGFRGIKRHIHVGELGLHELETADRLTELGTLVKIGNDDVEAGLHHAERSRRQHRALVIEAR